MLARERVLLSIEHRQADRTPADYGAHEEVTEGLIERLGVADYEELLQALGVDMRRVGINYNQPESEPDEKGYVTNMWGAARPACEQIWGTQEAIYPFDESSTVDDVHAHPWPDPGALDYSDIKPSCEQHHSTYAIYGAPWSPFFHEVGWMIGQENLFRWTLTKPDVLQAIIDYVVDYEVEVLRRFLEAAEGMIDVTYFGNDFGTQRGLVISPRTYERFFRRPLKRYFGVSHEYGCKVMKHSCGAIRDIIPMFIEDGVDMLDPVQVNAAGMELAGLVNDFGDPLSFHGGVDTQTTLPFGTVQDVREEVRSYIDLTHKRGGYILCGSQSYIEDIPLDNILAIYDENLKGT